MGRGCGPVRIRVPTLRMENQVLRGQARPGGGEIQLMVGRYDGHRPEAGCLVESAAEIEQAVQGLFNSADITTARSQDALNYGGVFQHGSPAQIFNPCDK